MTDDILLEEDEFSEDMEEWLQDIAMTCIAHMKHIESVEDTNPESLNVDDYGLLELERAFLVLYALRSKGGIPVDVSKTH